MGVSTDAILFWGLCFDEENVYPWNQGNDDPDDEEEFDPDKRYAAAVGIKEPHPEYHKQDDADWTQYWDKQRKAVKAAGCDVGYHCSDECSMYYVCVSDSETKAYRGSPKEIKSLDVPDKWREMLADYCKKMGIKTKQKPRWWLVSYWG